MNLKKKSIKKNNNQIWYKNQMKPNAKKKIEKNQ